MTQQTERRAEVLDLARLHKDLDEIKATLKDIFKILNGNGTEGLVTKVALNASSITRAWWWLSALSVAMLTAVIAVFKDYLMRPK
jgi:hypothetical protein